MNRAENTTWTKGEPGPDRRKRDQGLDGLFALPTAEDERLLQFEMSSTILAHAGLGLFGAEWLLFAEAYEGELLFRGAEGRQIMHRGRGTPVPQGEVVFVCAPLVAVTLYFDLRGGVGPEEFGNLLELSPVPSLDFRLVVVEVDVLEGVRSSPPE